MVGNPRRSGALRLVRLLLLLYVTLIAEMTRKGESGVRERSSGPLATRVWEPAACRGVWGCRGRGQVVTQGPPPGVTRAGANARRLLGGAERESFMVRDLCAAERYKGCVRLVRLLLLYVAMTLIVEMTERWICAGLLARSARLARQR